MRMIFALWNTILISAAVIAIVVIAAGLMIRVIEPLRALRRIGATLGYMVILIMVPPIIMHLWHSLSLWQQIGIVVLVGLVVPVLETYKDRPHNRKPSH